MNSRTTQTGIVILSIEGYKFQEERENTCVQSVLDVTSTVDSLFRKLAPSYFNPFQAVKEIYITQMRVLEKFLSA